MKGSGSREPLIFHRRSSFLPLFFFQLGNAHCNQWAFSVYIHSRLVFYLRISRLFYFKEMIKMTNVMLNTQLYQKMYAEQEQYKAYLLTLAPAQILDHASEYICRENILMAMENNDLSNARAKALLKSSTPLADVYNKYASWDHSRQQEEIWNAVEARSGEVLRAEFAAAQRSER